MIVQCMWKNKKLFIEIRGVSNLSKMLICIVPGTGGKQMQHQYLALQIALQTFSCFLFYVIEDVQKCNLK